MVDPELPPVVLIADDDPDDRLMMAEAFAERCRECRLCSAQDGVQLMRLLNRQEPPQGSLQILEEHPDLILLDLNMPLMDGREVLQAIKTNPALRHIPTVVMTTSDSEDDIHFCYEAGASSYIIKPPSYLEILDIVSVLKNYWINTVVLPTKQGCHD